MAKKGNTLTKHVQQAHRALVLANFMAHHSEGAARRDQTQFEKAINAGYTKNLITGAAVGALNIYAEQFACAGYGGVGFQGKELLTLINEANAMTQANAIANAYEVFEKFVRQVAVEYLYVRRGIVPIPNKDKQRMKKRFGNKTASENTKPWFCQLVKIRSRQNCQPLFKILFKQIPRLRDRVVNSYFGNLHSIHQAVETIRHCKTHANGRHNPDRFSKLPDDVQDIVGPCIKRSFLHQTQWILPSRKQSSDFIAREAEYAQILYDQLTRELGMKLDYTPGHDPAEVKSK